jgi:phage shock protein C
VKGKLVKPMENAKVLRRSSNDRVVAGVCGGLGKFFGINPVWFRLLFFILLLPGGVPGLLPYIILWIVIPQE